MTYQELRDYIDRFDGAGMVNEPAVKALRAVVELHEPSIVIYPKQMKILMCMECGDGEGLRYPCDTIQAIEKALYTNVDN